MWTNQLHPITIFHFGLFYYFLDTFKLLLPKEKQKKYSIQSKYKQEIFWIGKSPVAYCESWSITDTAAATQVTQIGWDFPLYIGHSDNWCQVMINEKKTRITYIHHYLCLQGDFSVSIKEKLVKRDLIQYAKGPWGLMYNEFKPIECFPSSSLHFAVESSRPAKNHRSSDSSTLPASK